MRFQFRLQRALQLLKARETAKRMEVAASSSRIVILRKFKEGTEAALRQCLALPFAWPWAEERNRQMSLDVERIHKLDRDIEKEEAVLLKQRHELERLLSRKNALESLRDRKLEDYRALRARRTQKAMDETHRSMKHGGIK